MIALFISHSLVLFYQLSFSYSLYPQSLHHHHYLSSIAVPYAHGIVIADASYARVVKEYSISDAVVVCREILYRCGHEI